MFFFFWMNKTEYLWQKWNEFSNTSEIIKSMISAFMSPPLSLSDNRRHYHLYLFICLFFYSFVHSFIRLFIYLFSSLFSSLSTLMQLLVIAKCCHFVTVQEDRMYGKTRIISMTCSILLSLLQWDAASPSSSLNGDGGDKAQSLWTNVMFLQ